MSAVEIPNIIRQYLLFGRWRALMTDMEIDGAREYGIVFVATGDVPLPDGEVIFKSQRIDTDYGSVLRFLVILDCPEPDRKCSVEVWINPVDQTHRRVVEGMLARRRLALVCMSQDGEVLWHRFVNLGEDSAEKIREQLEKARERDETEGIDFEDALIEAKSRTSPYV